MFHVIDDTTFICEFIEELISDLGYRSLSFCCPQEYIDYINSSDYEKPIGIFTDVTMPGMSGYDMINEVRKNISNLKFVIMTGEPEIRSEHMKKTCMFLAKPFTPESFNSVLEKLTQCHASSPSNKINCQNADNRAVFNIESWSCPNSCNNECYSKK